MKASITHLGMLFIESENSMESYALNKWLEENGGDDVFKIHILIDKSSELNPNDKNEKNL